MTGEPRKHIWFYVKSTKQKYFVTIEVQQGTHDKTEVVTEMYATGETGVADRTKLVDSADSD